MKSRRSGILTARLKDVVVLELGKKGMPKEEILKLWRTIEERMVDIISEGYGIEISNKVGLVFFVPSITGILTPVFEPEATLRRKVNALWRLKNEKYRKVRGTISIGELQAWFDEKYGEFSISEDRCGNDSSVQEEGCKEDDEEVDS